MFTDLYKAIKSVPNIKLYYNTAAKEKLISWSEFSDLSVQFLTLVNIHVKYNYIKILIDKKCI